MSSSLRLDWCSYEAAKYAVLHWHYSKAMPASSLVKIGVWEDGRFVGAIVFGRGATAHLWTQFGMTKDQGCELVRIAMRDHEKPVSQCVAIALRMLRRKCPDLWAVMSFADPNEGHLGRIYQAGNWIYTGRGAGDRFPVIRGKVRHPRTLSEMVRRGTVPSRDVFPTVWRPGKFRYVYPLTRRARAVFERYRQPYPAAEALNSDARLPDGEGGANPTRPLHIEAP